MHRVHKGSEPPCLANCRRELQRVEREADVAPQAKHWRLIGDCANGVRQALYRDQGGLCAYCGRRLVLPPTTVEEQRGRDMSNDMVIEHFIARSAQPRRMFDWDNLLGACSGRWIIAGKLITTCDEARGEEPLHIHPVNHPQDPGDLFQVNTGNQRQRLGQIEPQCAESDADTRTLNLNAKPLVWDRAGVVRELRLKLDRDDSPANLRRLFQLATVPGPDGLPPYAHVAASYLARKLRARNIDPNRP